MIIVGLTGGIGSGKSTVARMFEELGVPVYYSDDEAKNLMITSELIKKGVIDAFGQMSYESGKINRNYIAEIVFNDKEKLKELNAIVHPEVKRNFKEWLKHKESAYVIQENPLIFENKTEKDFDYIITVTAPEPIRIQRVVERDGLSKNQVLARIKNQQEDQLKINNSDFVITNDNLENTKIQVRRINDQLLSEIP